MQNKTGLWQQINFSQFCDSFSDSYKNNFTYKGKRALFDYLENLSEELGGIIELDTVALCCEYSEYADLAEIQTQYNNIETLEDLKDKTQVVEFDGGIIIQDF